MKPFPVAHHGVESDASISLSAVFFHAWRQDRSGYEESIIV
jgi:hypothetical protein